MKSSRTSAKKPSLHKATFAPAVMQTRTFWLGAYGGHYDIIVLFAAKPTRFEESKLRVRGAEKASQTQAVDCLAESNAGNLAADMALCEFLRYFPGIDLSPILHKGRPTAVEIVGSDLMQVELTLPCDEHGRPESINMHEDWR